MEVVRIVFPLSGISVDKKYGSGVRHDNHPFCNMSAGLTFHEAPGICDVGDVRLGPIKTFVNWLKLRVESRFAVMMAKDGSWAVSEGAVSYDKQLLHRLRICISSPNMGRIYNYPAAAVP